MANNTLFDKWKQQEGLNADVVAKMESLNKSGEFDGLENMEDLQFSYNFLLENKDNYEAINSVLSKASIDKDIVQRIDIYRTDENNKPLIDGNGKGVLLNKKEKKEYINIIEENKKLELVLEYLQSPRFAILSPENQKSLLENRFKTNTLVELATLSGAENISMPKPKDYADYQKFEDKQDEKLLDKVSKFFTSENSRIKIADNKFTTSVASHAKRLVLYPAFCNASFNSACIFSSDLILSTTQ